ncbi:MAG: uroporphyrinogen decarboxylase family protein [Anaerolineae bacterium]
MNDRERLLRILDHKPPDRIPWIPRLELWYNAHRLAGTLPTRFEGLSLREVERALGLGTPARDGRIFTKALAGADVEERVLAGKRVTEYHTPVGSVRTVMHYSTTLEAQGLPGRIEEYPLKGPQDYRVWEWLVEHTHWLPAYEDYASYDAEIGPEGLPMVSVGDVPFHEFLLDLAGYDHAFYQLADYPEEIAHLLAVMTEVQRARLWPVIVESPARLLLHGVHLSSQFTPPVHFERYVLPYYQEFMPLMHAHGKAVAMHADNDTSRILSHIERAGWDMVECFVTAPMVPLSLAQAREAWGERVIIWGGLPSLLLSPSVPEDEFRSYVEEMLRVVAPGDAFILGVADNVMPDSLIERVAWLTEIIAQRGTYPLA